MMKLKKILEKAKKINHKHIMAVVFVFILIYVGLAVLPVALDNVGTAMAREGLSLSDTFTVLKIAIDDSYSEILEYNDSFSLRDRGAYIDLNGLMARIMGQRYVNYVIRLDNGNLLGPGRELYDITVQTARLTSLNNRQQMYGREFLFVMTPHQTSPFEDLMPAGFHCYADTNADNIVNALRANGVPVLDMRYELYRDGISHAEAMFVTDHHWLPEIGFWAYTKIFEHFINIGALEPVDPRYTDINAFTIEVFEDWFLGSNGYRTGRFFAGVEDLSLIYPAFETDFLVERPWWNESVRGTFYETLFDHSINTRGIFTAFQYSAYLPLTYNIVHNDSAANAQTVLTLHDSFGNTSMIYFPLITRTNHFLDLRQFHGDFEAKYYEINPDIIVVVLSPTQINTQSALFNFFNE